MYITECAYRPGENGLTFYPTDADSECQCELRVTFEPLNYYPEERDTGQGADFDARIVRIEIRDVAEWKNEKGWHILEPRDAAMAEAFLEAHRKAEMWAEAEFETAEAFGFGDSVYRWAA